MGQVDATTAGKIFLFGLRFVMFAGEGEWKVSVVGCKREENVLIQREGDENEGLKKYM